MSHAVHIEMQMPEELQGFHLPTGVHARLQGLLDRQDSGQELSAEERTEAEGLVELSEMLSLLKLRAERIAQN